MRRWRYGEPRVTGVAPGYVACLNAEAIRAEAISEWVEVCVFVRPGMLPAIAGARRNAPTTWRRSRAYPSRETTAVQNRSERENVSMAPSTSKEIEHLRKTHQCLKGELQLLSRRAYLTPSEQERARILKKEKLRAKDRLRLLMQRASLG